VRPVLDHFGIFYFATFHHILILDYILQTCEKPSELSSLVDRSNVLIKLKFSDTAEKKCSEDTVKLNVCAQSMMAGKLLKELCNNSGIKSSPNGAVVQSNKAQNGQSKVKARAAKSG
jgi:hypothetical protein